MKTIGLTHGKVAFVDDEDYPELAGHHWFALRRHSDPRHEIWVAVRNENYGMVSMHREILGLKRKDGKEVLHINGDRLDNRRQNLVIPGHRIISRSRRYGRGKSQYKGVKKDRRTVGWTAQITIDGKQKYLGRFASEADAALAFDVAARKQSGQLAGLNFPDKDVRVPPATLPQALKVGRASRYRGVYWFKAVRKWSVLVRQGGRYSYLGVYGNEEDAARVADAAMLRLGKGREWLNFPDAVSGGSPTSDSRVGIHQTLPSIEVQHDDEPEPAIEPPAAAGRSSGVLAGIRAFFSKLRQHGNSVTAAVDAEQMVGCLTGAEGVAN